MSNRLSGFLRHWMLVMSMSLGIGIFLILYLIPGLSAVEEGYSSVARRLQPVPNVPRLRGWHGRLTGNSGVAGVLHDLQSRRCEKAGAAEGATESARAGRGQISRCHLSA